MVHISRPSRSLIVFERQTHGSAIDLVHFPLSDGVINLAKLDKTALVRLGLPRKGSVVAIGVQGNGRNHK